MSSGLWVGTTLLFIIFVILLAAVIYLGVRNKTIKNQGLLLPFSSTTVQLDGTGKPFFNIPKTTDGRNQISCPTGTSVNIVGAYFDVYDPYNTCITQTPEMLAAGLMTPNQKFIDNCKANPTDPICKNIDPTTFLNTVCTQTGSGNCKVRDVTDILGSFCNGKPAVSESDLQSLLPSLPYPCSIIPGSSDYAKLPASTSSDNSVTTGGYVLHGLFSCV